MMDSLPIDLCSEIVDKLQLTADKIRFRSVCKKWRHALPFPQPPWLMLAEDETTPNTRGFFGLGDNHDQDQQQQKVYQLELPEVFHTNCISSTGTWLATVDLEQRICLLNPFSRLQLHLPPLSTFQYFTDYTGPEMLRDWFIKKIVLSSSTPSRNPENCIAVAIHQFMRVAFARLGDSSWTTVVIPNQSGIADVVFYRDKFYGITVDGSLVVFNLGDHPEAIPITTGRFKDVSTTRNHKYLVEWMGELLLVIKFMTRGDEVSGFVNGINVLYHLDRFEIYKFDFESKSWTELKNLGDYSLFLGFNTSVSVLTSQYPGLKRNSIYYTDDYGHGYHLSIPGRNVMGVLDLETNTVGLHYKGTSMSLYSPPLWIVPQIHLPCSTPGEVN